MKLFPFIIFLMFACGIAEAGTITGTVRAEGKSGADGSASADGQYGSRKYKFLEKVNYEAMHDFVVYIEGPVGTNTILSTNVIEVTTTRIAQKGATFSPHVQPVMIGTTVEWPNDDTIYHNVFSSSDAKQFDLGLYTGDPPNKRVTFDKPGRVDVYCSIHANMHCVILVLQNPYFARTDQDGNYSITNVPPGVYKLKAWEERMPSDTREITVPAEGEVKVDFTLGIKNLPQY